MARCLARLLHRTLARPATWRRSLLLKPVLVPHAAWGAWGGQRHLVLQGSDRACRIAGRLARVQAGARQPCEQRRERHVDARVV